MESNLNDLMAEMNRKTIEVKKKRKKTILIVLGVLVFIAFIFMVIGEKTSTKKESNQSNSRSSTESSNDQASQPAVAIGEVLRTQYFNVVVNKVTLSDRVSTGNEFSDIGPEQGNRFLILNTTFKNIDTESRMIIDGSIWINYNGKDYEFDKSETIMLEGWGLFLDQINPLISKTTNLVYKIPAEINGPAYYQPGRSSRSDIIFLGNLN